MADRSGQWPEAAIWIGEQRLEVKNQRQRTAAWLDRTKIRFTTLVGGICPARFRSIVNYTCRTKNMWDNSRSSLRFVRELTAVHP